MEKGTPSQPGWRALMFRWANCSSPYRLRDYVTFLCPNKKVTKEIVIGEALTAKPIGHAFFSFHFSPASSRPTLCTPSGTGRQSCCSRYSFGADSYSNWFSILESIPTQPSTGAGWGSGGRVAQRRGCRVGISRKSRKTMRSTPPPSRLLWFVSCAENKK